MLRRLHNTGLTCRHNQPLFAAGNYVHDNGDAGMAMMESFNADVSDNIFENNKYGIRLSVGCGRHVFSKNIIKEHHQRLYEVRQLLKVVPRGVGYPRVGFVFFIQVF